MQILIPLAEVLTVARQTDRLPPAVHDVAADGSAIVAKVDVAALPQVPSALRLAARMAGDATVRVEAAVVGDRLTATIATSARGLDVSGMLTSLVADRLSGLPAALGATATTQDGRTVVELDLAGAAARFAAALPVRVRVTEVRLGDPVTVVVVPA